MNALAIPEIQTLPVMRYKDQPVVTTTMLAVLYGCKQRSIRDNFDLAAAEGITNHHMAQAIGRDASTVCRYFAKKRRAIMQTGGA
jgi:predicted transcriptional regulator